MSQCALEKSFGMRTALSVVSTTVQSRITPTQSFLAVLMRGTRSDSTAAPVGDVENVQRMVDHGFLRIPKQPPIRLRILEVLPRQMGRAHDDCARGAFRFAEWFGADRVVSRIDAAEVREPDRFGRMRALVVAECDETLAPVETAVGEKLIGPRRLDERREVREV